MTLGASVGARTSPSMVHRVAMAAKEKLVPLMQDTYIHADFCKGDKGGRFVTLSLFVTLCHSLSCHLAGILLPLSIDCRLLQEE
jgi:hypothetical protein